MNEHEEHYTKWNKATQKRNIVLSQLYVESTKVQPIKQSRILIVRSLQEGRRGMLFKWYKNLVMQGE